MRIREGDRFDPFEIKFQKVTVKTKPDKFGRTEQETLAVIPDIAPAAPKEDKDLDFTEMMLAIRLGNKATYAQWRDEMIRVTPQKKDKKTGKMKPGISEKTFDRR